MGFIGPDIFWWTCLSQISEFISRYLLAESLNHPGGLTLPETNIFAPETLETCFEDEFPFRAPGLLPLGKCMNMGDIPAIAMFVYRSCKIPQNGWFTWKWWELQKPESPGFPPPGLQGCNFQVNHVSNGKTAPGWLGYIWDYTTQLYRDYNKPL